MKTNKELKMTDEMRDLLLKWDTKICCSEQASTAIDLFWKMANNIYPETLEGIWCYNIMDGVIRQKED